MTQIIDEQHLFFVFLIFCSFMKDILAPLNH